MKRYFKSSVERTLTNMLIIIMFFLLSIDNFDLNALVLIIIPMILLAGLFYVALNKYGRSFANNDWR